MSVLIRGILISTLIQAYLRVLMRHQNKGSHKHANTSIYERAYERHSHKHANTSICERAYKWDSHKHANISIYERAYERDSHKHANTSIYMSVLLTGITINTLIQAYMCVLMRHQNKGFS